MSMIKLQEIDYRDAFLPMLESICGKGCISVLSLGSILYALRNHNHCLLVTIDHYEFRHLLLNSSTENRSLENSELPTLEEVVEQIQNRRAFLEEERSDGGLNGKRVKNYVEQFEQGLALKKSFVLIRDKEPGMRQCGSYYIADGMHRLVAYGLWSSMSVDCCPLAVYYCTNQVL
jgi:hypothetical protein